MVAPLSELGRTAPSKNPRASLSGRCKCFVASWWVFCCGMRGVHRQMTVGGCQGRSGRVANVLETPSPAKSGVVRYVTRAARRGRQLEGEGVSDIGRKTRRCVVCRREDPSRSINTLTNLDWLVLSRGQLPSIHHFTEPALASSAAARMAASNRLNNYLISSYFIFHVYASLKLDKNTTKTLANRGINPPERLGP